MNHPPNRNDAARCAWWCACLATLLACACAVSPAVPANTQQSSGRQLEISSITIEGNESFTTGELRAQMTARETPGWFNKFLYSSISERLGRKNEYFNAIGFGADCERLKRFYRERGFSLVRIDTLHRVNADKGSWTWSSGPPKDTAALIEQVKYQGVVEQPPTVKEDLARSPRIYPGDPYSSILLEEEVRRVLRVFADNGFANARFLRDSSYARRYTSSKNYFVKLVFDPGHRYLFGDITIRQEVDTLRGEATRDDITDEVIRRQLDYAPGEFFQPVAAPEQRAEPQSHGRVRPAVHRDVHTSCDGLQHLRPEQGDRLIRPRDKHELAPELLMSDQDGAFNLGAGLGYTSRNFLGGARIFNARVRFQSQTLTAFPDYFNVDGSAVSNLDLTFELVQPYVLNNKTKGTWSLSYILDKQKPYRQSIIHDSSASPVSSRNSPRGTWSGRSKPLN